MAYSKSNGNVIDDFSSSRDWRDVKVVTRYVWGSSLLTAPTKRFVVTCALSSSSTPSFLSFPSPYSFSYPFTVSRLTLYLLRSPFLLGNYSFLPIPSFPTPYLLSSSSILPYLFSFPLSFAPTLSFSFPLQLPSSPTHFLLPFPSSLSLPCSFTL